MESEFWDLCLKAILNRNLGTSKIEYFIDKARSIAKDGSADQYGINKRLSYLEMLAERLTDSGGEKKGIVKTLDNNTDNVTKWLDQDASLESISDNEIKKLIKERDDCRKRLFSKPSIDPMCFKEGLLDQNDEQEEFGIILFGFTRVEVLESVLQSLDKQGALKYTEVWIDGHQGNPDLKQRLLRTHRMVEKYPLKSVHKQNGNYGFRKMLLMGLLDMSRRYKDILVLEDDCFPTRDAVNIFRDEINSIRHRDEVFSVYGHHFLTESESEFCTRFQGWGWGTTSSKLRPKLRQLIDCYSMPEEQYLDFVEVSLSPEIVRRIDVTPPRQPTHTLKKFFAWDETLCLLTALDGMVHKPTKKMVIFNCGIGECGAHFRDHPFHRKPPFNMISAKDVWKHF